MLPKIRLFLSLSSYLYRLPSRDLRSLTLRKADRLQAFQNKIIEIKVDEVSGRWRITKSEKLHDSYGYSYDGVIKEVKMHSTFRRTILSPSSGMKSTRS